MEGRDEMIRFSVVTQEEMDVWPVDKARSGEKLWAETTWGGDRPGIRKLFNWNIWPCRVVFRVDSDTEAVHGEAVWRRSGLSIRMRGLKLLSAKSGVEILDVRVITYDQERIVLDFRPVDGPGIYYLYYGAYERWCFEPSADWPAVADRCAREHSAVAERIEARCELDNFHPMETIALNSELQELSRRHSGEPYLLFPEDRDRPIKLNLELPAHWAQYGPKDQIILESDRNEYRVFQLGVWACGQGIEDVAFDYSDLVNRATGAKIEHDRIQCLTRESRIKSPFIKRPAAVWPVPQGQIRSFWIGIDIPSEAREGVYEGTVTVAPKGLPTKSVRIILRVSNTEVEERGDHDLRRLSRLRWIESDVGLSEEVFDPYKELSVDRKKRSISTWGHTYTLNAGGLPKKLVSGGKSVLYGPITLSAVAEGETVDSAKGKFKWLDVKACAASWVSISEWAGAVLKVNGTIEFDGCAVITLRCDSKTKTSLRGLNLSVPYRREHAVLASGMGYRGRRVGERTWRQIERGATGFSPAVWMGSVDAGLAWITWVEEISVLGAFGKEKTYGSQPLKTAWDDPGKPDAARVSERGDAVVLNVDFGSHDIGPDCPWEFTFALLPTPLKPKDQRHWQFRYMHKGGGFAPSDEDTPHSFLRDGCRRLDEVKELGVKRLNLHDWWGPAFNYPWQWDRPDNLSKLTEEAHRRSMYVKVYNSGREFSTLAPEFWPLLYEGGGYPYATAYEQHPEEEMKFQDAWRQNHLPDTISKGGWPRLHREYGNEHAVSVSNATRIGNFYLEGMRYMTRFFDTDGAYWDGADGPTLGHREMAKRLWTIFRTNKPDAAIDVHHGDSVYDSPVTGTILCWPFIDSLWHGEGFFYDLFDPWTWLVEISGIPFNIPSEMLSGEEFLARGMLFGIWPRAGWGAGTEQQSKLWRFFDEFDIAGAEMHGFWEDSNGVVVDRPDVYVTTFNHPRNGLFIVIGSWHPKLADWMGLTLDVSLLLDRKFLGIGQGPLAAIDILSGSPTNIDKPVLLPQPSGGRLLWIRR